MQAVSAAPLGGEAPPSHSNARSSVLAATTFDGKYKCQITKNSLTCLEDAAILFHTCSI